MPIARRRNGARHIDRIRILNQGRRRYGNGRARPLAVALVAVLVAVFAAPSGFAPAGSASAADDPPVQPVVAPGVHVGPVDLSGMDATAARVALLDAYAFLGQGQIAVRAGSATMSITYSDIGRQLDVDGLLQEALAIGQSGTTVGGLVHIVSGFASAVTLVPRVTFDGAALSTKLADAAQAASKPAVNARAVATKVGFSTTPGTLGVRYDPAPILADLTSQLGSIEAPFTITVILSSDVVSPVITDAQARVAAAGATLMSQPVVLANAGNTWTIPVTVVHSWIGFTVVDETLQPMVNRAAVLKAVLPLASQVYRAPVSASWSYGADGVVVKPARDGRTLDAEATTDRIVSLLSARLQGKATAATKAGAVVTAKAADLSTEEAQAQASDLELLGTWTTNFQPAAHNGFGANIWIPATIIDGYIVQPGEVFSFWKAVGPVTPAKGYKLGGAIIGGRTQEGVALGGGICSTSTTLFNAALRAGFKMGKRANHYYYISRYPVGLDATVFIQGGSVQDMTWTNDSPDPVLIKAFNGPGSVTFSLFGVPTGRTTTFSKPIITNYRRAYTLYVPTSALPRGRARQVEYADDGFSASVTRTVTDASGKIVHRETYISHYATITGLIYVGTATARNVPIPAYAP
jgi:vancomycin resistance protein YoaR